MNKQEEIKLVQKLVNLAHESLSPDQLDVLYKSLNELAVIRKLKFRVGEEDVVQLSSDSWYKFNYANGWEQMSVNEQLKYYKSL